MSLPSEHEHFGLIRQLETDKTWSVPPIVYHFDEELIWRTYSYVVLPQTWELKKK